MMNAFRRTLSAVLPDLSLSAGAYRSRHRALQIVLWLQAPLLLTVARLKASFLGFTDGMDEMPGMTRAGALQISWMIGGVVLCAIGALLVRSRRGGAALVSLGLLLAAASAVTISGGLTDLHFGFFVVVALVGLYQDWLILAMIVVLTFLHHVLMGVFAPTGLYSSPNARGEPLRFALLHAGFVLAVCAVQVVYWRFSQVAQLEQELALIDKEQAVQRIAERFEALLQDSRDVVIVMDRQGIISSVNAATGRVMGFRPDELTGRRYQTLIHPDDLPSLIATSDQGRTEYRGERRMQHADRSWHWNEVTLRDLTEHPAVRGVVASHRDSTERRLFQERLVHDASHDMLTGLANRAELLRAIDGPLSATPDGTSGIAVLYLDLNGFKKINDTYGHESGDALLVAVAAALQRCVLGADSVGRLGGDEFAVVLHQISAVRDAIAVAERILAEVGRPVVINGVTLSPRVSIGIALADTAGIATDKLVHHADTAMYHAKRDSTTDWQLYLEGMHDPSDAATTLEDDLRHAVELGQLQLQYQPIVALIDGELTGFEALVRWHHPVRGLLQPADFIALADQSHLIDDVGQWVLREACTQVGRWQQGRTTAPRLALHVNLAARQVTHDSLDTDVLAVLAETGFAASDLVLEVVESALVDAEDSARRLDALRDRGIRIALDDFGAGASSLRYLAELPVDILNAEGLRRRQGDHPLGRDAEPGDGGRGCGDPGAGR
jgi:diguanylate cyclase (GGDEF)-like protein/PAS domain S-box-containing protein